ncbi:hypothetical protein SXIM_12520 [Streptomyces xiamenensis]|uniref:Uncharacterized protein n=1 Tax=Streptomyces xiamenensis TaxID=408015 RepID=A0A0F7CNB8_9ACTN|nr:hypothetical protein SXIM_12520 [Streptomyces xiamenensis]
MRAATSSERCWVSSPSRARISACWGRFLRWCASWVSRTSRSWTSSSRI